jgi:hypothetical protein
MSMDPITAVGLVAAASQLAGQALGIVRSLWNYGEAVKKAPKRSAELRQEMGTLCNLLESLNDAINNPKFVCYKSLNNSFQELKSMLAEMNARVNASQTDGLNRLKWPFTMDENKRLLSRISRYKETFDLALDIQTAYSSLLSYVYSSVGPIPQLFCAMPRWKSDRKSWNGFPRAASPRNMTNCRTPGSKAQGNGFLIQMNSKTGLMVPRRLELFCVQGYVQTL